MRPDVLAGGVLRVKHADVKLVDDQVAESRRAEARVVPGIIAGIAHDAVAVRIPVELELARIGIALEALAAGADDVEAIEVAVLDSGHEAGPKAIGVLHQQIGWHSWQTPDAAVPVGCRNAMYASSAAGAQVRNVTPPGDNVRAHRRARGDVQLGCGHGQSSASACRRLRCPTFTPHALMRRAERRMP